MSDIIIDFDWIDPGNAKGDELRATWARLSLSVDGEAITRVYDKKARSVREDIYLPLYPLAEWLATHWWSLWREIPTDERRSTKQFNERHCLRNAREGFSLPALWLLSQGDQVRLQWESEELSHQHVEFLSEGVAHLDLERTRERFQDFIQAVIDRLWQSNVQGTLLEEEWSAICDADEKETEFCATAGALGLEPYAIKSSAQEAIISATEKVPVEIRQDFLSVAGLKNINEQASLVLRALDLSHENRGDLTALKTLKARFGQRGLGMFSPPQEGYKFAKMMRGELGLNGCALKTTEELGTAFGVSAEDFQKAILSLPSAQKSLDVTIGLNDKSSPGFVLRPTREAARRFHLTRALFEYLTSSFEVGLLVTEAGSNRQKRNRAFAAEFLAPSDALKERVKDQVVDPECVDELAEEFGVSPWLIAHQLQNHGIAEMSSLNS